MKRLWRFIMEPTHLFHLQIILYACLSEHHLSRLCAVWKEHSATFQQFYVRTPAGRVLVITASSLHPKVRRGKEHATGVIVNSHCRRGCTSKTTMFIGGSGYHTYRCTSRRTDWTTYGIEMNKRTMPVYEFLLYGLTVELTFYSWLNILVLEKPLIE